MLGNRLIWNGAARRLLLLKWAACAGLLCGLLLSIRLWTSDHGFPAIPVLGFLPALPQPVSLALFCLLLLSIVGVAVLPRPRLAIYLAATAAGILVLFDITRLQPWLYLYLLMLLALSMARWDEPESRGTKAAWAVCAFILVATYIWSGIQKENVAFVDEVFPWLLRPLIGADLAHKFGPLAYGFPVMETCFGILLLLRRTRSLGLAGIAVMHCFLLVALSFLGYNSVVWPWNFWMPVMAFALFLRNDTPVLRYAWEPWLGKAIILLIGVVPALSFVDLWDDYLSASLYSGRSRHAFVFLPDEAADRLPATARRAVVPVGSGLSRLDITWWALYDLNVPPYPEVRVYQAIARRLQAGTPEGKVELYVRDRPGLKGTAPKYRAVPID